MVGRARLGLDTELGRRAAFAPVVLGADAARPPATSATPVPSTSPTGSSADRDRLGRLPAHDYHDPTPTTPPERGVSDDRTEPCVSLTTGTLSPDQRVNYAYGMVLGVDEFLTEQQYRLEKGYRHERALHGFGTSTGCRSPLAPAADDADDVSHGVAPGCPSTSAAARSVITCDQCARLGAWLAAQEQALPGAVGQPPRTVRRADRLRRRALRQLPRRPGAAARRRRAAAAPDAGRRRGSATPGTSS